MKDDDSAKYDLVMPFVTVKSVGGPHDDVSYVAGYEMGLLDAHLAQQKPNEHEATVRTQNVPQLDLIAMLHGYSLKVKGDDNDWTTIILKKSTP